MGKRTRKIWTTEEIDYLKAHFANNPTATLADKLSRSAQSVSSMAYILGLKKDEEHLLSVKSGRFTPGNCGSLNTRFKKGHKPWNYGLKGFMSANSASFKKGQRPHNYKPVGSKRLDKEGYIMVKVKEPNVWVHEHKHVWEATHGEPPKGYIVRFIDGNKHNIVLSNLELISRKNNMLKNSIQRYPAELQATIKTLSKLQKTIEKHGEQ